MIEALAATLARTVGPVFGASRRNRIIRRIRAYHELAEELNESDPGAAEVLRSVAGAWVTRLAEMETASLARRIEPAAVFFYLLVFAATALGAFFAWTREGWWTWPVLAICVVWAMIVAMAAYSQFWEMERVDEAEGAQLGVQQAPP